MYKHTGRIAGLLGFLVAIVTGGVGCPPADEIVVIRDSGLEQAIRRAIPQPFGLLTKTELAGFDRLDARGLGIRDISALQYCKTLRYLDLDTNSISDINALTDLKDLESLNLDSNQLTDITPLRGLVFLRSLSLFDNQIGDIQALVTNAEQRVAPTVPGQPDERAGLGPGDSVVLGEAQLSEQAIKVDVPRLQQLGVNVILATGTTTTAR